MESIPEYDHHLKSPEAGKGKPQPPWRRDRFETLRTVLIIVGLVCGVSLLGYIIFAEMMISSDTQIVNAVRGEELAPDGKHRAVLFYHSGPPEQYSGVALIDGGKDAKVNYSTDRVYAIEFHIPLRMHWDDASHLTITYPSDADNANTLEAKEELRGIKIKYVGEVFYPDDKAEKGKEQGKEPGKK